MSCRNATLRKARTVVSRRCDAVSMGDWFAGIKDVLSLSLHGKGISELSEPPVL
jgi:hypothetical protein